MEAIENLKSVLCDPDSKCCISGSTEDRRIVDAALEALQAENARLTKECDSFEVANIAVAFERDKALARLAEIENQEHALGLVDRKAQAEAESLNADLF